MSYKVIDNFLEEDMFRQIKVKMESQFFPWFYEPEIAKKGEKVAGLKNESHFYLAHMFYQYYLDFLVSIYTYDILSLLKSSYIFVLVTFCNLCK